MPEAVACFTATRSPVEVARIHQFLAEAYLQDIAKYAGRVDRDCLARLFETLPACVGEQIKYTRLYPEKRIEQIKRALHALERALIIRRVSAASAQALPLGADASDKIFKCLFADIGLMRHLCGVTARDVTLQADLLATFRGKLAEQFIGQELLAECGGSENGKLYYWARNMRNSSAEVDYLWAREGRIIPIEVKSGAPGRMQSLRIFLAERPQIPVGLVLHADNIHDEPAQRLRYLPLYTRFQRPAA